MNVLSIPTWMIHISSVIEWIMAIWLIWVYGTLKQNSAWHWFALAMLPALISAMCACTWHLFDNLPELEWLVTIQAWMTLVGNITLCLAAWWLWKTSPAIARKTAATNHPSVSQLAAEPHDS